MAEAHNLAELFIESSEVLYGKGVISMNWGILMAALSVFGTMALVLTSINEHQNATSKVLSDKSYKEQEQIFKKAA